MKLALLVIALLAVSCAPKAKKKEEPKYQPICGGDEKSINCLPNYLWQLELAPTNLPEDFAIMIDGKMAAMHCDGSTNIETTTKPDGKTLMSFGFWFLPKKTFKIEYKTVDENCSEVASLLIVEDPAFSVTTITAHGRESKSVYVILD